MAWSFRINGYASAAIAACVWPSPGGSGLAWAQAPGKAAETFAQATPDGAWSFFSDPRAIEYRGTHDKTYLAFLDKSGSDRVWSIDHATGQVDTATLHARLSYDDHNNPSLYLRKDGRITAYYQRHDVDRLVFHRTTVRPEDITAWGREDTLRMPENVTYANPFRLDGENGDAGRLYLFNRSVGFHPTLMISDDDGGTFGKPVKLIGGPGQRPYVRYASDGQSTIHFAFTDGHPRDEPNNSIYYMQYRGGSFYKADGTLIRTLAQLASGPIEPSQADKVYDGKTSGRAWIWDIALDSKGRPVLAHSVCPTESDHRYHYARWNGRNWEDALLTKAGKWFPQTPAGTTEREPHYSGGIHLDPIDPSIVYLSKPSASGIFEIEKWTTADSGRTWASKNITSGSAKANVRPILSRPARGQKPLHRMLFWMNGNYVHYTDYSTGIRYYQWTDSATTSLAPGRTRQAGNLSGTIDPNSGPDEPRDAIGRRHPWHPKGWWFGFR